MFKSADLLSPQRHQHELFLSCSLASHLRPGLASLYPFYQLEPLLPCLPGNSNRRGRLCSSRSPEETVKKSRTRLAIGRALGRGRNKYQDTWQELSAWGFTQATKACLLQGGVSHDRHSAFQSSRDGDAGRERDPSSRRRTLMTSLALWHQQGSSGPSLWSGCILS